MALRRGLGVLLGVVLSWALVAACTTGETKTGADPSPSPTSSPTPEGPVTITLAVFGPEAMLKAYDDLAAAFTAEHPEVTVDVQRRKDVEDVMSAVGAADPPDVFLMDNDHVARLVQDRRLQPVDRLLEARNLNFGDGFQRGGLTAFAANASLQCMPQDVSPLVVYYNQDLVDLRRLGTPDVEPPNALDGWTWETFTAAARQASRGRADGVYIEPSLESVAPFLWSAGGDIVDDVRNPTTLTLSDDGSRDALEQLLSLVRDPRITPTARELAEQDAVTRFTRGELGMIVGTRALTPRLRDADKLHFDVMPLPTVDRLRTVADVTGYCISADTEHVQTAADFVAFAVGRKGATITARPGYVVPSNLEVANSAAFAQTSEQPQSSFVFNEGVRRAQTMPFSPAWPRLSDRVRPPLHRLFYAPVIDLEAMLQRIDKMSTRVLPQPKQ